MFDKILNPTQDRVYKKVQSIKEILVLEKKLFLMLIMVLVSSLIIIISMVIIHNKKPPDIFLVNSQNEVSKIYTMPRPFFGDRAIKQWVSDAIVITSNIDHVHYQEQLSKAQPYFSPDGWGEFINNYSKSKLLNQIVSQGLIMSTALFEEPEIMSYQNDKWTVAAKGVVIYKGDTAEKYTSKYATFKIYVEKMPTSTSVMGVAITRYEVSIQDQK